MSRCYCNCCPEYIKSTQYNFFGWWRGGVKAWESTAGAIRIAGQRRRPKTDDDDDGKMTTTTTTTTGGSQYNSSVTIWLQEIGWAHWTLAIPIVGAGSLVDCLQMIVPPCGEMSSEFRRWLSVSSLQLIHVLYSDQVHNQIVLQRLCMAKDFPTRSIRW